MQLNSPYSDSLSLRLRNFNSLTLLHTVTRRLMLQKAHGHPCGLPYLVSVRFQDLFHSAPAVLFTFPSQYLFTIGHYLVFSLTKWSSQIPTELHVLRGTQVLAQRAMCLKYGAITRYGVFSQTLLLHGNLVTLQVH